MRSSNRRPMPESKKKKTEEEAEEDVIIKQTEGVVKQDKDLTEGKGFFLSPPFTLTISLFLSLRLIL